MFKRLETSWNTRTPVWLHNRTKENIIFQLSICVLLIFGMYTKDWNDRRLEKKRRNTITPEN